MRHVHARQQHTSHREPTLMAAAALLTFCAAAGFRGDLHKCSTLFDTELDVVPGRGVARDFAQSLHQLESWAKLPPFGPIEPREVHLALGATADSMIVTWVTREKCSGEVTVDGFDPVVASSYQYSTPPKWWPDAAKWVHSAVLEGLTPGADFEYTVGAGGQLAHHSRSFTGTVPEADGAEFTVALMGDVGSVIPLGFAVWDLLKGDKLGVDAVVHAGDVSYAGMDMAIPALNVTRQDEFEPLWDLYGEITEPTASRVPYQVGIGNHEAWYDFAAVSARYPMRHSGSALPEAAAASTPFWWAWERSGVHFLHLSTEHEYTDPAAPQRVFAEADLAGVDRAKTPWVVVVFHRPMYCTEAGRYDQSRPGAPLQVALEPVLLAHGVDLVVAGHAHLYQRIHPVNNGTVTDMPVPAADGAALYASPSAPVHVVVGFSGAMQVANFVTPGPDWSAKQWVDGCDKSPGAPDCGRSDHSPRGSYGLGILKTNATHAHFQTRTLSSARHGAGLHDEFWITKGGVTPVSP